MANWVNENEQPICSDCNWELQGITPRFSRRHYQAFASVINMVIDDLDNQDMTKARKEASAETLNTVVNIFCQFAETDNVNFNEQIFRSHIAI